MGSYVEAYSDSGSQEALDETNEVDYDGGDDFSDTNGNESNRASSSSDRSEESLPIETRILNSLLTLQRSGCKRSEAVNSVVEQFSSFRSDNEGLSDVGRQSIVKKKKISKSIVYKIALEIENW